MKLIDLMSIISNSTPVNIYAHNRDGEYEIVGKSYDNHSKLDHDLADLDVEKIQGGYPRGIYVYLDAEIEEE